MEWTVQEFGSRAALRYDALIKQALKDIAADPERPGSTKRPEIMIEGARSYHISFSRTRMAGTRVKRPRHVLPIASGPKASSRCSASFTTAGTLRLQPSERIILNAERNERYFGALREGTISASC